MSDDKKVLITKLQAADKEMMADNSTDTIPLTEDDELRVRDAMEFSRQLLIPHMKRTLGNRPEVPILPPEQSFGQNALRLQPKAKPKISQEFFNATASKYAKDTMPGMPLTASHPRYGGRATGMSHTGRSPSQSMIRSPPRSAASLKYFSNVQSVVAQRERAVQEELNDSIRNELFGSPKPGLVMP